jgi:CDP-paratose 2-epimerase
VIEGPNRSSLYYTISSWFENPGIRFLLLKKFSNLFIVRILITGICGFVGFSIARYLREAAPDWTIFGIDNLSRPGSETNRLRLGKLGVGFLHGDVRSATDMMEMPPADFVIDAAANPSVLAGVDGKSSSRQIVEHNLHGTINILEFCKRHKAGFILLSTSRVYSIPLLARLPLKTVGDRFTLNPAEPLPEGISEKGVAEIFSTATPVSLYGCTKLCSEALALEYGATFQFPVYINRCGVIAGAGQFGRADQGIFSYWVHSWNCRKSLKYIGFGGQGLQVRDALHPLDVATLVEKQLRAPNHTPVRVLNISGGLSNSISLKELSDWCAKRLGAHSVASDTAERPFDIPWMILDSSLAEKIWGWKPQRTLTQMLDEIALHAEQNPEWLDWVA